MHIDFDRVIERQNTDSLKWSGADSRGFIPMWVADMDFAAPDCVVEALRARVDERVFGYPVATEEVTAAVLRWTASHYGWRIDPDWIVWLPGLVPGIHVACRGLSAPGDEILTLVPVYPPFLSAPRMAGRSIKTVCLRWETGRWKLDVDELAAAITRQTRLLLFCNPHNPVGRAFGREELLAIAETCERHGVLICSDEVHGDLLLDSGRHVPLASLSEAVADRTVTLMSPSKTFNLSGLACGFAVIPNGELRRRFQAAARDLVPQPNVLGYVACRAAYEGGEAWRTALIDYRRTNRDLLESFFSQYLPQFGVAHVEATYLAWIDARSLGERAGASFFEAAGVRLSDGDPFQGPGFVRLNFACPRRTLRDALVRIAAATRVAR